MALPMVHLLGAWLWAQDRPGLRENPDYYLGAISPDAIHIRDGDDKSHKNYVHYNNWRTPDPDAVLGYWRERHSPFDIGYGIHVLLDGQWVEDYRARFPQLIQPDGMVDRRMYYSDTCNTDFELYHTHPQIPHLLELLRRGVSPDDHPMLTKAEFDAWREETFKFYDRPCPSPLPGPARYLDLNFVLGFLNRCQGLMTATYRRLLDEQRASTEGSISMNPVQQAILDRRSTRGFSDEPLTEAELAALADAALASPSARNCQDWHFSFVTDRALLDGFSAAFRAMKTAEMTPEYAAKYAGYDVLFHPPLCVFISLPERPNSRFAQVDAGIAVQNLALSAMGLGLGSVILGMPIELFRADPGWEAKLGFPAGHHFAIAIAIGRNTVTKDAHPIGEGKLDFIKQSLPEK